MGGGGKVSGILGKLEGQKIVGVVWMKYKSNKMWNFQAGNNHYNIFLIKLYLSLLFVIKWALVIKT